MICILQSQPTGYLKIRNLYKNTSGNIQEIVWKTEPHHIFYVLTSSLEIQGRKKKKEFFSPLLKTKMALIYWWD